MDHGAIGFFYAVAPASRSTLRWIWPRRMRRSALWVALALACALMSTKPAAAHSVGEAELEAGVLLRLPPFFQWASQPARWQVCVFEDAPAKTYLERAITGRSPHFLELKILARSLEGLETCQMVFVDGGMPSRLPAVVSAAADRPVLIVARGRRALDQGAAVAFSLSGSRLVFDVHLGELRRRRMSASAQFLRLAREVSE